MSDFKFTHLHVHSQYSLLDGKASISGLVDRALEYGMRGLALTDHGNMFGIKEFFNYVEKVNSKRGDDEKLKPILGCEMYVAMERLTEHVNKGDNGYHLIVLAKNETGYHNLIKLVSKAWTEGIYYKPRTDRWELEKHHEGLIICSACLGGEIPQHILNNKLDLAEERTLWFKKVFGDDFYLELQRHKTDKPNANYEVYEQQEQVNKVLIELAHKHNIKLVATNDVHFVDENDAEAHDRLICISTQKKFAEPRMHYSKQEWLKSTEQMKEIFSDVPEALLSTQEILDKVVPYSIDHSPIMPTFDIPKEFGTEEEYRQKYSEKDLFDEFTQDENGNVVLSQEAAEKKIKQLGGYDKLYRLKLEADYLKKLTMDGAKGRYGDPISHDVAERLNFELYIMKTMGFPGYFLIVQDFINAARNQLGVSVGPGRGSAAGSAAAYCLGITDIDPIKYDLLFERFLNPDRISLPDIDVDFDDDGRYEVLKYVTEKYGEEKVAHIITYQTMAAKTSVKDLAKIMDVPLPESNRLARMIPDSIPLPDGSTCKGNLKNCIKYIPEFGAEVNSPNEAIREVMKYAPQLEGNVRTTGVHACGVIICRDDITDWVPVMMGTDADGSKVISTQYEGSVIEQTGLIKMDFLGLKTLTVIKEVLSNIRQSRGIEVDIDHIPLDDPATFKLYCDGNTTATFQFESAGMQKSLRDLQPSKFEDLIAMNALYRPGPMDYIGDFIDRKHGRKPIVYDIPIMEKYLSDTYGITVYQEQVMLLSRLLANFTRGESDALRKAMGKKLRDKLDQMKPKFIEGGTANGHDPKVLEKIWGDWEKFASYAFNKSHATCYSWVAYQTAYLKANYPAEFMAGVMSCNLNSGEKLRKFMDESRKMGIVVKGPDVNESMEKFGVTSSGEIRFGLGGIKGVGSSAVHAIIDERKANGPFKDIYDFVERVNMSLCNRATIESLALAGAFDCFKDMCREMFVHPMFDTTYSELLVKYGQQYQSDKNNQQASLFGDMIEFETNKPPYPVVELWSDLKRLEEEKKLVSIYLSAHPLDKYYMEITYGCNCTCADFDNAQPRTPEDGLKKLTLAGLVTNFQTKISKKGTPYGIVELEDFSGKTELRLFGQTYNTFTPKFVVGAAVYIEINFGQDRYKKDSVRMNIDLVEPLESYEGNLVNAAYFDIDENLHDKGLCEELMKYESPDGKGGTIYLRIIDHQNKRSITMRSRRKFKFTKEFAETFSQWPTVNNVKFTHE